MAEVTTRELFDRYYEAHKNDYMGRVVSASLDRPELFEYEESIGKEFLDMDVDDLIGLLGKLGKSYSFNQIMSMMRDLFNFYINFAEVKIMNPFNDKRMVRRNVAKEIVKDREPLRFSKVEEVIGDIRVKDPNRADYVELILRLWYDGFHKADDIVDLKESDINLRGLTVQFPGRTVHLSTRSYELLKKFSKMEIMEGRINYAVVPWHGSFFRFIVRQSKRGMIEDKTKKEMMGSIYYTIKQSVNDKYNVEFNYRNMYWLGFFDFLCGKYGEDKVNEMILSYRSESDIIELESSAREYEAYYRDATSIKKYLMELVRV